MQCIHITLSCMMYAIASCWCVQCSKIITWRCIYSYNNYYAQRYCLADIHLCLSIMSWYFLYDCFLNMNVLGHSKLIKCTIPLFHKISALVWSFLHGIRNVHCQHMYMWEWIAAQYESIVAHVVSLVSVIWHCMYNVEQDYCYRWGIASHNNWSSWSLLTSLTVV